MKLPENEIKQLKELVPDLGRLFKIDGLRELDLDKEFMNEVYTIVYEAVLKIYNIESLVDNAIELTNDKIVNDLTESVAHKQLEEDIYARLEELKERIFDKGVTPSLVKDRLKKALVNYYTKDEEDHKHKNIIVEFEDSEVLGMWNKAFEETKE